MKLLLVFVIISFAFASEKIDSQAGCTYHGKFIPEGIGFVPAPIGFCLKVKCIKAEGNTMGLLTCPSEMLPSGAHFTSKDLTKEYPNCCPKIVYN